MIVFLLIDVKSPNTTPLPKRTFSNSLHPVPTLAPDSIPTPRFIIQDEPICTDPSICKDLILESLCFQI